jgi:uncharacterized protein (TIGR00725 family)
MNQRKKVISIIGGAKCSETECQIAEKVGYLLGMRGVILICGGRGGVMEAACRGSQNAGGITIGLLPGDDLSEANPYLDVALPTGMGHIRNALVAQAGECVIAIGGGYGTLSEIGIALKSGRKVIGIDTWNAVDNSGKRIKIIRAKSAEEAVGIALNEKQTTDQ